MSQTRQHVQGNCSPKRLFVLAIVLLGCFALYAPAIRLTAFGSDIALIAALNNFNLLRAPAGAGSQLSAYSPFSLSLWWAVKVLFGFPSPNLLHFWNVWLHTLNMALLAALSLRLAKVFRLNPLHVTVLSVLIFGLFPFSYEAVLSAAAVDHLLMTALGMAALVVYLASFGRHLSRRASIAALLTSGLLLSGADVAHAMGIIFGVMLLVIEIACAVMEHRRPRPAALVLFLWSLLCAAISLSVWDAAGMATLLQQLVTNTQAWYPNAMLHAQGLVVWVVLLLRNTVVSPQPHEWIVLLAFVVSVGVALVGLWYVRRLRFGLLGLTCWLIALLPSALLLNPDDLGRSPRLLYEPSIGIALFSACVVTCLIRAIRWPMMRLAIVGCIGILLAWCALYVIYQRDQVARLTPAFSLIAADMRKSFPADTVLLVNAPGHSEPASPVFLLGAQGMELFPQGRDATSNWLAANSGIHRQANSVRYEPALGKGERFKYEAAGLPVDDKAYLAHLLQSNLSYQFEYADSGLRARRLALVNNDQTHSPPFARFSNGSAQVALRHADAALCGTSVALELAWSDVRRMNLPTGVFVHVMDVDQRQAIVADGDLLEGNLPLDQVPTGIVITETRVISVPANTAPLKQVELGAYLRTGQVRMLAVNADGGHWAGDAAIVPIDADNPVLCRRIGE